MTNFFFFAFSFMLTHEMDAVRRHEWKVFPFLSRLTNDDHGYLVFTAIHLPLYLILLWGFFSKGGVSQPLAVGFDIFSLVHIALHLLFMKHPGYQFNNWFSWTLILGSGLAGGLDLLVRR
jgi:hypothetical protein